MTRHPLSAESKQVYFILKNNLPKTFSCWFCQPNLIVKNLMQDINLKPFVPKYYGSMDENGNCKLGLSIHRQAIWL